MDADLHRQIHTNEQAAFQLLLLWFIKVLMVAVFDPVICSPLFVHTMKMHSTLMSTRRVLSSATSRCQRENI